MIWADMNREERIAALEQACHEKLSFGVFARRHHCTRSAAIGLAHRAGITWHRSSGGHKPPVQRERRGFVLPSYKRKSRFKPQDAVDRPEKRPPAITAEDFVSVLVPFIERERNQCAWPLWEHGDEHRNCCGNPVDEDDNYSGSYCPFHRETSRSEWFSAKRRKAA